VSVLRAVIFNTAIDFKYIDSSGFTCSLIYSGFPGGRLNKSVRSYRFWNKQIERVL
jgi:hypothetical protein